VTVENSGLRGTLRALITLPLLAAIAALAFVWTAPVALASYSSIVIDAETGKVISEYDADAHNFPASLTKMMTLYLLFESSEQGKVRLDQQFAVSSHAAAQAPSKLGLIPGDTVAVRDLILGLVTKSANDAAVVVAEGLGGSEPAFAERMTQKARALGMASTTYRNASGLPNPGQITTARDLVRLARALYRDFPREYAYFATEEFSYRGARHINHNHLMHAFEGMDGIKTGYIRASGFNLAASAVRDNHRLIGVVMGGQSAHGRDMKMAQLLNTAFAGQGEPSARLVAEEQEPNPNTLARRAARTIAALSPVGRAEAATAASAKPTSHRPSSREAPASGRWSIQVGAFAQQSAAEKTAAAVLTKLPGAKGKTIQVMAPQRKDKERVYRARIAHFSESEAQKACRALHKKHKACTVVAPSAVQVAAAR
jgi:D-alanyl-D-alanine carboxypeptidase